MKRLDQAQGDIGLRELSQWAQVQVGRLAANFDLDVEADRSYFALAQMAKLGEEVGELNAEVLGAIGHHGPHKAGRFSTQTLAGELADVTVCVALLAQILDVDLAKALESKIADLERRSAVAK